MKTDFRSIVMIGIFTTSSAFAFPVYGPTRTINGCYSKVAASDQGMDRRLAGGGVGPIEVYLQAGFAANYESVFQQGPATPLTQTQAAVVLQDAMEVWNREARGPLLVFKGEVAITADVGPASSRGGANFPIVELRCTGAPSLASVVPNHSIIVIFAPQGISPTKNCIGLCQTSGNIQPVTSTFPQALAAAKDPKGVYATDSCGGETVILYVGGTLSTFHNLKGQFVHEFGHALGLRDAVRNMSVMAPGGAYFNTVGGVFADRAPVLAQSASTDFAAHGAPLYSESAPYPEGISYLAGTAPDYTSITHNIGLLETGNRLRRERLHQVHLWPYDMDCVDDESDSINGVLPDPGDTNNVGPDERRRNLSYWSEEYAPSTGVFRAVEGTSGDLTSKGFVSGNRLTDAQSLPVYGLYHDDPDGTDLGDGEMLLSSTGLNGNGSIPYSVIHDISGTNLKNLTLAPTVTTVIERQASNSSYRSVLLYAKSNRIDITTGADPNAVVATLDPPVWRQQRGAAIGDADGSQDLYACTDAAACNERLIQTHIPIASTFNVTADITIFATVPTRGNCFTEDRTNGSVAGTGLTCGRIYLHAGYATNSANDNRTFRQGVMFEAEDGVAGKPDLPEYVMPPHNYPQGLAHKFTGRTDVGVGVACAPVAEVLELPGSANCILTWVDSGTPDGRVLAGFFSVDAVTHSFTFGPLVIVLTAGSPIASVSDLSAAYFDDRFWLAWKSATHAGSPARMSTLSANAMTWGSNLRIHTAFVAADAPVWVYDPQNGQQESAFVFTAPNAECIDACP